MFIINFVNCNKIVIEAGSSEVSIPVGENSWFTAMIQILMNTIGSTVIVLPYMITKLGWIAAPAMLSLAALMSFFSGYIYNEVIDIFASRGEVSFKMKFNTNILFLMKYICFEVENLVLLPNQF